MRGWMVAQDFITKLWEASRQGGHFNSSVNTAVASANSAWQTFWKSPMGFFSEDLLTMPNGLWMRPPLLHFGAGVSNVAVRRVRWKSNDAHRNESAAAAACFIERGRAVTLTFQSCVRSEMMWTRKPSLFFFLPSFFSKAWVEVSTLPLRPPPSNVYRQVGFGCQLPLCGFVFAQPARLWTCNEAHTNPLNHSPRCPQTNTFYSARRIFFPLLFCCSLTLDSISLHRDSLLEPLNVTQKSPLPQKFAVKSQRKNFIRTVVLP